MPEILGWVGWTWPMREEALWLLAAGLGFLVGFIAGVGIRRLW